MRCLTTIALCLCAAVVSAQEPDAAGLMIDEHTAVAMAMKQHPFIDAAHADARAADATFRAARRAMAPNLQLSARYARLSSISARYRSLDGIVFPQLLDSASFRADVVLPVSDMVLGLAANMRALGHAAEASKIEVVNARAQLAYDARAAFLTYWRAKLALDTASELVRAADVQVRDQQERELAGTVARSDVLTFQTALGAAQMSEQAVRADLAIAEATLRAFFPGLDDRALLVPSRPTEELDPAAPVAPDARTTPPRIAVLEAQVRAAGEKARAASLDLLPKLSLYGSAEVAAPNPRVLVQNELTFIPGWEAGARLEWSLSQATVGSAELHRARAQHRALAARTEDARRRLHAERTGARQELAFVHLRVQQANVRVRDAAALVTARRSELEAGAALPLNVVLAETDLARAKNDHVQAVVDRAMAVAKLDFLDGRVEPSAVNFGVVR